MTQEAVLQVLRFWFGEPQTEESTYPQRRKLWFGKDPDLDQTMRDRFLPLYEQAASGQLDHWQQEPSSCVALLVLLDQFPRNLFRGTSRSFATDSKALAIAKQAIAQGLDQQLEPIQRFFFYLPLEHSENRDDQRQSVQLFRALAEVAPELNDTFEYAVRHQEVVDRFGRFPHRNAILGRDTTSEEAAFLTQPGSSF